METYDTLNQKRKKLRIQTETYDTLKAWGISKEDLIPKKIHQEQIKELNEQLYSAYGRIAKLTKKIAELKD